MKKVKTKMERRSSTCSNPDCGRAFSNPIIVHDLSSKKAGSYQACPYCLTEITIEPTQKVEESEQTHKLRKIEPQPVKAQTKKTKLSERPSLEIHGCTHHFGYLSQRSKKEKIPEECMTCEKIVQCMLKNVTG